MHEAHVGARAEHCDYEEGPLIIQVVPKSQRNDAPALAQADVGIALGAGTDVVVEAGDVILVRSTPLDAVAIVRLARSTYRKMVQNLGWATGYNAVALPLAAAILYPFGIILTPAVGAVLMSASTILVAINSRFLKLAL